MNLFKERIGKGKYHIHVGGPFGVGCTLCGYAYEGESGNGGVVEISRGTINCGSCIKIIKLCKSIPARKIRSRALSASPQVGGAK